MTSRRPRAFALPVDPHRLLPPDRYPFGMDPAPALEHMPPAARRVVALARALVSSPVWAETEEAILVVRAEPPEGIVFMGNFTDAEAARLEWLPAQLENQLPQLRYVSWAQAEVDVDRLASTLVDRFGRQEVRDMQFVGIPRGGLIVLGMLTYALDLRSRHLALKGDGGPVVVVDDCAISGLRFGEFLRDRIAEAETVVFAHLYSHPGLRRAIEAREPRVGAVVAARDLRDLAPEIHHEDLQEWRSRWEERSPDGAYWIGQPEHVAFAWSEPDLGFWDASTGSTRVGWRLVPPEACLKNRSRTDSNPSRLQIQVPAEGALRLAPGTFHGELDGRVLLAELESGQLVSLSGVAADFWREFLPPGEADGALDRLEARYDAPREQLRSDAEAFLRTLLERGFVTATPSLGTARTDPGPHV
jgi:hypothetical protein